MIRNIKAIAAAGALMVASTGLVQAQETALSGSVSIGYDSIYNFRGVDFGTNSPWVGIDMNLSQVEDITFNIGAWYANPSDNNTDELDLYGFVGFDLGPLEVAVGATYFYFSEDGTDAIEAGFTLGYQLGGGFSAGAAYWYDFEADGAYYELNLARSFALSDALSFDVTTGISAASDYYGVDGMNHWFVNVSLPLALSDNVTLSPYFASSVALDGLEESGEGDHFYGGVSLEVGF